MTADSGRDRQRAKLYVGGFIVQLVQPRLSSRPPKRYMGTYHYAPKHYSFPLVQSTWYHTCTAPAANLRKPCASDLYFDKLVTEVAFCGLQRSRYAQFSKRRMHVPARVGMVLAQKADDEGVTAWAVRKQPKGLAAWWHSGRQIQYSTSRHSRDGVVWVVVVRLCAQVLY
jgi:hypothetical protein